MGDTGPCGPCSEIFYDHGDKIWGGPPGSPEQDGDRFIEIWNLVFMQFEQLAPGVRNPLPKPSIDTGAGLERVAAVLQGKHDNYDIDLFVALIRAISELTGADPQGEQKASLRVIADHLRASSFLIADGVLPSNEGRGYVLRRIMRRAMRHAQLLGARDPLMYRLVWALVREMGQAYPELVRAESLIEETLRLEETRFRKTLERGLTILDEKSSSLKKGDMFDGDTAFTLYDTYGFPLDLTQDALRNRGIRVDIASFTDAMDRQRAKARAAWAGSGDTASENVWFPLREKLGATEFLGYETETAEGVVGGAGQGRQGGREPQGRRERRHRPEPDAVLCGVRRPGRRHRPDDRRGRAVSRHRHPEEGRRSVRASRHGRAGHAEARHGAAARGRSRQARLDPRPSLRDASAARGAAAGARRSHRPARLAGGAGPAALRLRASEADHARRTRAASRISPTTWCWRMARSPRG